MDGNRIGRKHDWTKSFGPKPVGRKCVGRKVGAHTAVYARSGEKFMNIMCEVENVVTFYFCQTIIFILLVYIDFLLIVRLIMLY